MVFLMGQSSNKEILAVIFFLPVRNVSVAETYHQLVKDYWKDVMSR
jgi:hypothetical protein